MWLDQHKMISREGWTGVASCLDTATSPGQWDSQEGQQGASPTPTPARAVPLSPFVSLQCSQSGCYSWSPTRKRNDLMY